MNRAIFSAKASLLSMLPVRIARKWLQHPMSEKPVLQHVNGENNGEKQLLIDVSVIISNDARTGIQRVVRALLLQLLLYPPAGCRVRPVFATRKHGYHYAPDHFGLPGVQASSLDGSHAVKVGAGDMFLGLDLAAHLLPLHRTELAHWKRLGAEIHVIVYDLLPVLHPDWFNPKTTRKFRQWLKTIAIFADGIICNSNTVKAELDGWLCQQYSLATAAIPVNIIPLGADIQSSAPSRGLPENLDQLLSAFASKPTVLMVGTLEPRKGHSQVLIAFEKLWKQGRDINLVIVGKPGWKTEALQQRLRSHPQRQARLYWLDNVSDELLELLYTHCTGVIAASEAEGFGLPLIEAMHHNKPVLARDISVFREIGGNSVTYFSGASTDNFINDMEFWLSNIGIRQTRYSALQCTWQDSARELLLNLGMEQPALAQQNHGQAFLPLTQGGTS